MLGGGALAKQAGVFGYGYNRVNYKFDQGQRWARFTAGRGYELKRYAMFREDVSDLASVTMSKMKLYVPVLCMALGYVLTVFVEARSGLKFPAPPTFASGLYLQCLGVSFGMMTLSVWLCFHAAMRANVMMVQLRTRRVRLPVPSQRQLDSARKILSTYEEQSVYDMFRLPFVMPNSGDTPPGSDDDEKTDKKAKKQADKGGYSKGGLPGVAAKVKGKMKDLTAETGGSKKELAHAARIPGTTAGAPSWIQKELEQRDAMPKASPSTFGNDAPPEPYEHFELIRNCQKEFWCAEAYGRVTFLIGKMHLIQSFAYWLVLHCIAELGMVWCSIVVGTALTAGIWIMFRLDVLPTHGGCFPIEAAGPIVQSISLAMAYTHHPTQTVVDISKGVAILCYLMQMTWTLRLYMVSQPANSAAGANHQAKESGDRMFNQSASCESPAWLPAAFQHVSYLVAPPKTKAQLEKEQQERDNGNIKEDPMVNVDMTPWYYVRTMLIVSFVGWSVLLCGRIIECVMGERMLVTNPGQPPWTRAGQWYGWESGPISSKHYAHVTPQRGHFAWQRGWGPQGQQELWASDMFGFHPEADMHWAEPEGPEPLVGVAGKGENTWNHGVIKYARVYTGGHDWLDSGGHRRLREVVPGVVRPVVPAAVHWPAFFEPELLACGPEHGQVAALAPGGMGAFISEAATGGLEAAHATPFSLQGIVELGMAHAAMWSGSARLLVSTGSGSVAACPVTAAGGNFQCDVLGLPTLPTYGAGALRAAVIDAEEGQPMRVAVAAEGGRVLMHELASSGLDNMWRITAEIAVPLSSEGQAETSEIAAVAASHGKLLVTTQDGSVFQWTMRDGQSISAASREAPAAGPRRSWSSACALPTGKVMRLASNWRRFPSGQAEWQPELLI